MVREPAANVLIASVADAAQGALSIQADGEAGADLPWIDHQSVAALHLALQGLAYDVDGIDVNILADHNLVYTYNEMHGGWLFRFPNAIVDQLARLTGSEFDAVLDRWQPALQQYDPPADRSAAVAMLRQIVSLAKAALRQNKPMFWLASGC